MTAMEYVQAELELALLHITQVEHRIAEQQSRIARLRGMGSPTVVAEDLLLTLQMSLGLLKSFLARITGPAVPDKISD